MQVIIDRIEGNQVIVEFPDMTTDILPLSVFPGAKEGDVYHITKDESETADRRKRIQEKFSKLKRGVNR